LSLWLVFSIGFSPCLVFDRVVSLPCFLSKVFSLDLP